VREAFSFFILFGWCIYEDGEAEGHSNTRFHFFVRKLFTVVRATNVNTALAGGLATLLLRTNIATQNESA
jgi:hypothetical protein